MTGKQIVVKSITITKHFSLGNAIDTVKLYILAKYDQIERDLIEDFKIAHHEREKKKMKKIASVLSHFKVQNSLGRFYFVLESWLVFFFHTADALLLFCPNSIIWTKYLIENR